MKSWFQFLQTLLVFTIVFGGAQWGCTKMFCVITGSEAGYYPLLGLAFSFNAFISMIICGKHWAEEKEKGSQNPSPKEENIMSMEQNAGELVVSLSDLKAEYESHYLNAQKVLREYVVTTHYPIADRFEVWAEWCKKKEHGFIHEADVPLLGRMREDEEPNYYERYQDYDWLFFLECFNDEYEGADMREKYGVTVDDVKELLIEQNFGSFTMD